MYFIHIKSILQQHLHFLNVMLRFSLPNRNLSEDGKAVKHTESVCRVHASFVSTPLLHMSSASKGPITCIPVCPRATGQLATERLLRHVTLFSASEGRREGAENFRNISGSSFIRTLDKIRSPILDLYRQTNKFKFSLFFFSFF